MEDNVTHDVVSVHLYEISIMSPRGPLNMVSIQSWNSFIINVSKFLFVPRIGVYADGFKRRHHEKRDDG